MTKLPQYAKILRDEFEKRKAVNNRYSVRAFSQLLNTSSSTLSMLIRGKTGLSKNKASEIAKRLLFNKEETAYFTDLVISESGRSKKERLEAQLRLKQYGTRFNSISLNAESFQLISQWYSFPVMELIRIYGADVKTSFLAKKLGIPTVKVKKTKESLERLGILKNGEITTEMVSLPDGPADLAVQKLHSSLLDKAKKALQKPKEKRNITAQILRMRQTDFKWAAQELRDLRRKLVCKLEEGDSHDSIFSISVQWVRLDRDIS